MNQNVKKVVICVLLIFTLNFSTTYSEAGYTQRSINGYFQNVKQEMQKEKNFYKKEYKKQIDNPNYTIKDYKQIQKNKIEKRKKEHEKFIEDIGKWRYYGSKVLGDWVLYLPKKDKVKKALQEFEESINAECEQYRKLNPLYNGFVPYNPILPFGA